MKKVLIFAESGWAVGRIHRDLEKYLSDEFQFIYCNWGSWNEIGIHQAQEYDLYMTLYLEYSNILQQFPCINIKKYIFVAHGFEEMSPKNPSPDATYGMTSKSIQHLFPKNIIPFNVPNCVELTHFNHKEHTGKVDVIGWCGAPRIWFKQFKWAEEIAKQMETQLQVSSKSSFTNLNEWKPLPFAELLSWYSTLDILLVTSIPNGQSETGPLPAFEAIASGVVVIGTAVGNFAEIPGPKFTTVEEAVCILNDLKQNPEKVKQIAKEQYDCIVEKWNYKIVSEKWREMFHSALKKSETIHHETVLAYPTVLSYQS
jgi:hypothetical protein